MRAWVESIGLFAPGLVGWNAGREVLAGRAAYDNTPLPKYKPALLPPNERRRATNSVRIAFGACEDAVGDNLSEAADLAAVFASSGGDYGVHDQICRALMREEIAVSPTHFHNSVHNAAAGYWSIATGAHAPSVSLSAHDSSVAAGLLEALPLVTLEQLPTLLVFSDCEVVATMHSKRPVDEPFSCALWLTPEPTSRSLASVQVNANCTEGVESTCANGELERLRCNNPAARVLPLLELLALNQGGTAVIQGSSGQPVAVTVQFD